ncbi:MAG: CPBP family intramembrane glutamic endopeptidase [Longimicrobiales bacterium]
MRELVTQFRNDFGALDRRALFALLYAPPALACIAYFKHPAYAGRLLDGTRLGSVLQHAAQRTDTNLYAMIWWGVVLVTFYFVVPALCVRFIQNRPLHEIGVAFRVEKGFLKLALQCVAIVLPLTYLMSRTPAFTAHYPFLRVNGVAPHLGSALLAWELVYIAQFFALEFFFRGFLLHSLKPVLGLYSILVMVIPYTMIHFSKPMPEAIAAIGAGLFLGWLSYRSGTIWLGVLLHCAVAVSMDFFSLLNQGLL